MPATASEGGAPSSAASSRDFSASFLDEVRIDFGPHELIGRYFLQADAATRDRGVRVSFAPMQRLVEINRQNPETWKPLLPHYDPDYGGVTEQNAFCLLGENGAGEVVATQAARLYDLAGSNLHELATTLRLFYPDPARMCRAGEACMISAPSAKTITGRIAFSGAAWYRPDFRGCDLSSILPRIGRAYAHAIWNTDWTVTFMAKPLVERGLPHRVGYTKIEWDVVLTNAVIGPYHGALLWMGTEEMLLDLSACLDTSAQIDAGVHKRSA